MPKCLKLSMPNHLIVLKIMIFANFLTLLRWIQMCRFTFWNAPQNDTVQNCVSFSAPRKDISIPTLCASYYYCFNSITNCMQWNNRQFSETGKYSTFSGISGNTFKHKNEVVRVAQKLCDPNCTTIECRMQCSGICQWHPFRLESLAALSSILNI